MIASRYALQIFWVLATALVYTLLALAVAEKDENDEQQKCSKKMYGEAFLNGDLPTIPWIGLTAPSITLKTSTTALSLRMVFWSITRKFWWEKKRPLSNKAHFIWYYTCCRAFLYTTNTWSSLTIMKQSRRSKPLSPNVPRVFWISEKSLLLVTSWWLFRSYQVFNWSM